VQVKAIDRPFTKIINGTSQYVIPVFQRDYSWTEPQCTQLWNDVLRIAASPEDRGHFLGSLVYIATGDSSAGFTRWLLIDGQQRMTTLMLLIMALRDHIEETGWKGSENGPTTKRLDAYFLKNVQEEGERLHKLVLRRHDQATLAALINRTEMPANTSEAVRDNYELFRESLAQADPEKVYEGVGRLIVVDVTLTRGIDDPQLIFESLNSTGVDLSQSDLIRNFILMRLPEKEQTRLYEFYWSKIELIFRGSERVFDTFMRDYIALRTRSSKQEKADDIYFAFRREFGALASLPEQLEGLLKELLQFAQYHAAFSLGWEAPAELKEPLARLRGLIDVPATLVMRLFECMDLGSLTVADFRRGVELIESYVFRRAICGEQTRGYWQIFANLAYRVSSENPFESLQLGLATLTYTYQFPGDLLFRENLENREIYHLRVCKALLERLENFASKELADTSKYSIEHVMPQNGKLNGQWRQMLGETWRDVHREWLHRLGNLTLTGYNSTYSDRPFAQKKTIAGGFNESSVRLNKFIREQEFWTAKEMKTRGKQLAARAVDIWPRLEVDKKLVDAAIEAEMRERANRKDVSKVPMTPTARELFELLRGRVKEIDPSIIEVAESRSVSYHGPTFFLEVLPRKNKLNVLLALDFNEVKEASSQIYDASTWAFIVNATYDGGVYADVEKAEHVEVVMPVIRDALEFTRAIN
jgi:predicted transport protein